MIFEFSNKGVNGKQWNHGGIVTECYICTRDRINKNIQQVFKHEFWNGVPWLGEVMVVKDKVR